MTALVRRDHDTRDDGHMSDYRVERDTWVRSSPGGGEVPCADPAGSRELPRSAERGWSPAQIAATSTIKAAAASVNAELGVLDDDV